MDNPISEAKSLDLTLEPKTRNKALIRSFVIPGYGQFYKGDNFKGYAFLLSSAGAAALAIVSQVNRNYAVDCYIESKRIYDSAVSQPHIDFAYAQMQEYWKEIKHQED